MGKELTPAEEDAAKVEEFKRDFVNLYPIHGTVGKTMKALGVPRGRFYTWLKDEEFFAIYQILKKDRIDDLVSNLYDCVKGKVTLDRQQLYAAFFLLRAFDPKTFTEKHQMLAAGVEGAAVKVTHIEVVRAEKADSSRVTPGDFVEVMQNDNKD